MVLDLISSSCSMSISGILLSNGVVMPQVGLGTYPFKGEKVITIINNAWEEGYRSFDTAWAYKNEESIGRALKKIGVKREEVFLTSKLHINDLYWPRYSYKYGGFRKKTIAQAYDDSCKRLDVDYLDLYLIHWPFPKFNEMWRELVRLYKESKVRAIGVCQFLPQHIDFLFDDCGVYPHVNQIEMNPYNCRFDVVDYCRSRKISLIANSPLGGGVFTEGLLSEPVLQRIAFNHDVTSAQIVLRWALQKGFAIIPRSGDAGRMRQNINTEGFSLNESEVDAIDNLNLSRFIRGDSSRVGLDGKYFSK